MKIIFALTIIFCAFYCGAQNRNNIWVFGDSAGVDFANINNPVAYHSSVKSRGSCTNICDSNGVLKFYAFTRAGLIGNTTRVFSHNNILMLSGDSIVGQGWYNELVILPFAANTNQYYLFSIGVTNSSPTGLYYSIVDMSLNNGLGAVVQKNVQLLSYPANDGLIAVKHGNGRDWWVLFRRWNAPPNDEYFKFLVSPTGISGPFIQHIGTSINSGFMRFQFNKAGTQLAMVNYDGLIELYYFDRCTCDLYNYKLVRPKNTAPPSPSMVCCEFSENGRFLYVSTNGWQSDVSLIQIDLQDTLLFASADTIANLSTTNISGGFLKRGKNNKIYWSNAYEDGFTFSYPYSDTLFNTYNNNLSVINSPDSPGLACNFSPFSFNLGGGRTYWGLPNNPDYDLGRLLGSPCDTLQWVGSPPAPQRGEQQLHATYISAWEKLFINASGLKGKNATVTVYDGRGSAIKNYELKIINGYATLDVDCTGWANGLYVVHLQTEKEVLSKKFIKE